MSEKSLLDSVIGEIKKAERESAKAKLKTLLTDLTKARKVVDGIEDQIVELLTSVGETEEDIRKLLAADE